MSKQNIAPIRHLKSLASFGKQLQVLFKHVLRHHKISQGFVDCALVKILRIFLHLCEHKHGVLVNQHFYVFTLLVMQVFLQQIWVHLVEQVNNNQHNCLDASLTSQFFEQRLAVI